VIILADLHILSGVRKTAILSQYRPDWVSERKPEYNCARVVLVPNPQASLAPGQNGAAILQPMSPELWAVEPGDELEAREGSKTVAVAKVVGVLAGEIAPPRALSTDLEGLNQDVTLAIFQAEGLVRDAIRAYEGLVEIERRIADHPDSSPVEREFGQRGTEMARKRLEVLRSVFKSG